MLESTNPDLIAHQGSPTKHPAVRLDTIRTAGELKIPFTSGILVGIGESESDRMASLEALAGHEHIQEIILQNFVPHRKYYGEEPAEIATEAAEASGPGPQHAAGTARGRARLGRDMAALVERQRLMPGVGIRVPPNLADWWPELVQPARRPRPLRQRRSHRPSTRSVAQAGARAPREEAPPRRAAVRLPAVHRPEHWLAPLTDVIRARTRLHPPPHLPPPARRRARPRGPAAPEELRRVRRGPPRGDRGHAPGRR
jgi:FO synthase